MEQTEHDFRTYHDTEENKRLKHELEIKDEIIQKFIESKK